jgi:DNA-binding CsgD family transcriptional regulator/DNA-binding beta-propeller fold protein YncE
MAREVAGRAPLSRREQEVAALVAEGLTNRAIAARLFISERTVDGHLEHIREKLGVNSRAQVAVWFAARPAVGAAMVAPSRRRVQIPSRLVPIAALAVLALVAIVAVPRLIAPPTHAGPSITVLTGTSAGAELRRPTAEAIGPDGLVYVADTDNLAIKRIDPERGSIRILAGGHSDDFVNGDDALAASIGNPTAVAVGPDGKTVYFANGSMVGRVDPDSTVHLVTGRPSLLQPVGIAFAPNGSLYIADLAGNAVWVRTPDGVLSRFAGKGEAGSAGDQGPAADAMLNHPHAVAVDASGDVLIADTGSNRIRRVEAGSNRITTLAGGNDIYGFGGDGGPADHARLSLPWGLAVGPDGNVYIADTGNDVIRRVTRAGIITTVAGGQGVLYGPAGLAISPPGDVYVADMGHSRLVVIHGLAAK